jgi:hypothetical protein
LFAGGGDESAGRLHLFGMIRLEKSTSRPYT